jgi:NhaP-type Na+/H+ or K+/H+ antiporter
LTLEFVQSILYPGWLGITTVLREFLVISGLGHIAYGAALGLGVWWLLRRNERPDDQEEPT